MPELPEVEVVRRGLAPAVSDAVVSHVEIFDSRSLRRHVGAGDDFITRLTGRRFLPPTRRGKFLWLPLEQTELGKQGVPGETAIPNVPEALVVHLGMSGQVLLRDRATDDARTRIRIEIEHPTYGPLRLNFVDQRLFGSMAIDALVPAQDTAGLLARELIPSQVSHIARDPIDPLFDDRAFFSRLRLRNSAIKRALLDQALISGIGNIYADEALWAARVHYDQPASSLGRTRAARLLGEVRLVLAKALAEGGTSFDAQYVNVNGASGYFAHSLNAYGRHGSPCPRCSTPIVREAFMNRGSHFCPVCQRLRLV